MSLSPLEAFDESLPEFSARDGPESSMGQFAVCEVESIECGTEQCRNVDFPTPFL